MKMNSPAFAQITRNVYGDGWIDRWRTEIASRNEDVGLRHLVCFAVVSVRLRVFFR